MRSRIIDLRNDEATAQRIADALRLQTQFGYEHARDYLHALGVDAQLAQRLLAIRYDRRGAQTARHGNLGMHQMVHEQFSAQES